MFSENYHFSETYGRDRLKNSPYDLFLRSIELGRATLPVQIQDGENPSLSQISEVQKSS